MALRDEMIIHFLGLIDFVRPGFPPVWKWPIHWILVPNVADNVAILNLRVINVVQDFHARRVHALHHVDSPGDVVEHVVLVIHFAVEIFHARC